MSNDRLELSGKEDSVMRRFRQRRLRWWIWLLKQEKLMKDEIIFDHAEGRRSS